jgi:CubicO group peptidase (beta-lactamase class C family)
MTLQQWMATFKAPGLSVAVFDRHEIVWAKTYGVKQAGGADPVTLGSTAGRRSACPSRRHSRPSP